jgi:hypothetical protein
MKLRKFWLWESSDKKWEGSISNTTPVRHQMHQTNHMESVFLMFAPGCTGWTSLSWHRWGCKGISIHPSEGVCERGNNWENTWMQMQEFKLREWEEWIWRDGEPSHDIIQVILLNKWKQCVIRTCNCHCRHLKISYVMCTPSSIFYSSSFQEGCPLRCYAIYDTKVSLCYKWMLLCYCYDTRPLRPSWTTWASRANIQGLLCWLRALRSSCSTSLLS